MTFSVHIPSVSEDSRSKEAVSIPRENLLDVDDVLPGSSSSSFFINDNDSQLSIFQQIEEEYSFKRSSRLDTRLEMKYFNSKFYLQLLTHVELAQVGSKRHELDKQIIVAFLTDIGTSWYNFLTEELEVHADYLSEFICRDFRMSVQNSLRHPNSTDSQDIIRNRLDKILEFLLEYNPSMNYREQELGDSMSVLDRICVLAEQQFKQEFIVRDLETAKRDALMRLFGRGNADNTLELENVDILAEIMLYMDHGKLLEKMNSYLQQGHYQLSAMLLYKKLKKLFGPEIVALEGEGIPEKSEDSSQVQQVVSVSTPTSSSPLMFQ